MNTQALVNTHHHYNPDWLSDEALISGFVARMDDFTFLRDELAQTTLAGSAQHYLIVGVRGAGKTTLLKRLAIAIRQEDTLSNHLIALSFPEELYQVKDLADFWWACCEALADELDRLKKSSQADALLTLVDKTKKSLIGEKSELKRTNAGLDLLQSTCALLKLRPVLLIDNLDLIFNRIDKAGRKLKNPHAPAYWSLREALSNTNSPIVIGGSVRLSEQFTEYDKAFYDFFIPKRLGKLSIFEVREVIKRLAEAQNTPEVTERLNAHPGRLETLYELTGGNPRAIGLIFQLLQQSPGSKAVDDFERLMDITTPYYKARFEDLAEQAQVVMHALAVRRPTAPNGSGLRFGHTAAEIGEHAGLLTSTVSAQLDNMDKEGLIEKSSTSGRTQYRIAEQLFRLWLQMRGSRRIRQNVLGLTEFLEAMFSVNELLAGLQDGEQNNFLSKARYAFAMADSSSAKHLRQGLEAKGVENLTKYLAAEGGQFEQYIGSGEITEDLRALTTLRSQLEKCRPAAVGVEIQNALLGACSISLTKKKEHVRKLCDPATCNDELKQLKDALLTEQQKLIRYGLTQNDIPTFFRIRAGGCLPIPFLSTIDAEQATPLCDDQDDFRKLIWRVVGLRWIVNFTDDKSTKTWLEWGRSFANDASSAEWANVSGSMRVRGFLESATEALEIAFQKGETSRAWHEKAALLDCRNGDKEEIEQAYLMAASIDDTDPMPWTNLGDFLAKIGRYLDSEKACRKSIQIDSQHSTPWHNLGRTLNLLRRYKEAEAAYRESIRLSGNIASTSWNNLGNLLTKLGRSEDSENAFRNAIELDSTFALPWRNLGLLLINQNRLNEARAAFEEADLLDPKSMPLWVSHIDLLQTKLFVQKIQKMDPTTNLQTLRDLMLRFPKDVSSISVCLASKHFVEEFLSPSKHDNRLSQMILVTLREMNCDKFAKPLLLAFEAIVENRVEALKDLEPELQSAAAHMYKRLTA
jgi:tetratricopeptide (TPR) repeat protein